MDKEMINNKLEDYYLKISNNPLNYLPQYIAPQLVGREWYWIRRGALLTLVTQNDLHTRVRLHMLLVGAPGTGKTEFLLWMQECFQGMLINAEFTSKVGLIGNARGSIIKPGLLADYDGNILLIDELDKMSPKDQNGLLQAMEEGTFCIIKGSHRQRYKSEIRVISTANILKKIQKPLLDRFDFIFYVGMSTRRERANNVNKIIDSFMSGQKNDYTKTIVEYLKWIENHNANMSPDDEFTIRNMIEDYILNTKTNIHLISYRSLELSILRIAYAMAKLEKKTMNSEYIKNAIWLKDQILRNIVGANQYHR